MKRYMVFIIMLVLVFWNHNTIAGPGDWSKGSYLVGKGYGYKLGKDKIPNIPLELLQIAKESGMDQVDDFFMIRGGMVKSPYVYGYLPGKEENSAAFWAEKQVGGRTIYYLLVMNKIKRSEMKECVNKIEWINPPGSLTLLFDRKVNLDEFVYIDDKTSGPSDAFMEHNGILSEDGGTEELFYCYGGRWLVRQRH